MTHTRTLVQNFARRDAHRLAQKVSLLVMASLMAIWQWAQGNINISTPDEAIVTIMVGVIAYVVANRTAQSMLTTAQRSEDELISMFFIADPQ